MKTTRVAPLLAAAAALFFAAGQAAAFDPAFGPTLSPGLGLTPADGVGGLGTIGSDTWLSSVQQGVNDTKPAGGCVYVYLDPCAFHPSPTEPPPVALPEGYTRSSSAFGSMLCPPAGAAGPCLPENSPEAQKIIEEAKKEQAKKDAQMKQQQEYIAADNEMWRPNNTAASGAPPVLENAGGHPAGDFASLSNDTGGSGGSNSADAPANGGRDIQNDFQMSGGNGPFDALGTDPNSQTGGNPAGQRASAPGGPSSNDENVAGNPGSGGGDSAAGTLNVPGSGFKSYRKSIPATNDMISHTIHRLKLQQKDDEKAQALDTTPVNPGTDLRINPNPPAHDPQ